MEQRSGVSEGERLRDVSRIYAFTSVGFWLSASFRYNIVGEPLMLVTGVLTVLVAAIPLVFAGLG